ncbi:MAG: polyribonucleotide nucleotidyltransferase [Pirellulales bacterium]|nr:polyribonucleotide nucleotidyltransferase [Thermoguttaceae bacterium]MDD4788017.1 polyribonucleotide nucleotidyltransferase [Pirellulales bacterium]MDI9443081.1 polyribonucleotide nucleotidyltransferase [Planctomycetota bacterium]NLZ02330.1 polyribonucleotide nucleotidyltransferase [Pirellulaceae bacterium]
MKVRVEKRIGNKTFWFETGELAKQAAGSCLIGCDETVVLATAVTGPPRPGIDFFPLMCDYRERVAAAGKFPGGFLKREGRPTLKETLTARLIDRPIRPLFPHGYADEVQIQAFVLASDRQMDGDVLAMNGASLALGLSPIPFQGPIASVRLGLVDGKFVPFPTNDELEMSDLDLIISGSESAILMIEGFAREMPEDLMADAIMTAQGYVVELCGLQREIIEKVQPVKAEFVAPCDGGLADRLRENYYEAFKAAKQTEGKQARAEAVASLKEKAFAELIPDPAAEGAFDPESFRRCWHDLEQRVVRDLILAGRRPDGRGPEDLRPITCKVDLLPRVHGSALFQRGETQALVTVTLGTPRDEQRVDGLVEEYSKKFMLDYYFPPFSVGECRPIRGPGRREFGHGALAERSVKSVLPSPDDFPYTIRIISDILESNGSSSMASVCGATLGLMAAGVPISNPVAGISTGLVKEGENWVLLTDIIGDEDHFGDMDFKVAGTQNGITGIQLDLKIDGINEDILRATLKQTREARIEILRNMLTTISRPRTETSRWAPRLLRTTIDPEKIGLLIGPGGKTIRAIQEGTGASIDVDDDGVVTVACSSVDGAEAAMAQVEALTASIEVGRIYDGKVISIKDFGAFVEILPGKDGLCHISELSDEYVANVSDVCHVGDRMKVKVIAVDDQDRVKLSRRAAIRELDAGKQGGDEDSDD